MDVSTAIENLVAPFTALPTRLGEILTNDTPLVTGDHIEFDFYKFDFLLTEYDTVTMLEELQASRDPYMTKIKWTACTSDTTAWSLTNPYVRLTVYGEVIQNPLTVLAVATGIFVIIVALIGWVIVGEIRRIVRGGGSTIPGVGQDSPESDVNWWGMAGVLGAVALLIFVVGRK